jgi:hypothetical protein
MTDDARYSAGFLINFFQRYAPDLAEHWHYLHLHDASCGMSRRAFNAVAGTAGLFINIRGASFFRRFVAALSQSFYPYRSWLNQIVLSELPPWSDNVERWRRGLGA